MADWVQMGRVWVKVEPEATAVVQNRISGWKWTRDTDGVLSDSARPFRSAEDAMVDYDAIYDPQPKPIEAVDRGPDWSFWKSEDGTRAAFVQLNSDIWYCTQNGHEKWCEDQSAAEAAAAKYVGGEG